MTTAGRAALGFMVGAGVTLVVMVLVRAGVWVAGALWPTPDANIGLGLLMLAVQAVAIPLGIWWALRRLGVPAAGLIAAGAPVVYGATLCMPFVHPASVVGVLVQTLVIATYTGAATWLTSKVYS
jgi:hypothetical protein